MRQFCLSSHLNTISHGQLENCGTEIDEKFCILKVVVSKVQFDAKNKQTTKISTFKYNVYTYTVPREQVDKIKGKWE